MDTAKLLWSGEEDEVVPKEIDPFLPHAPGRTHLFNAKIFLPFVISSAKQEHSLARGTHFFRIQVNCYGNLISTRT